MEVKRFRAATIQEALNMVKRDLGSDALILSTRKLGGGTSAAKTLFEVSAISGDKKPRDSARNEAPPWESFEAVKADLTSIKEMLSFPVDAGGPIRRILESPGAVDLYMKLVRGGISESNARVFLKMGGALDDGAQRDFDRVYEQVLAQILKVIHVADPFRPNGEQVVAAFVGPTGVGKTTTVAKLVAEIILKQKRSVGLISIDNYRIGAVDQLRTYAAILGVPCFAAFTEADLKVAFRRLCDRDVILIDTAGQSHYDLARMDELARLIRSQGSIKCHLLLSATTRESELEAATKSFNRLPCTSTIFTKTDETRTRGIIINQALRSDLPISYVTTGQKVPEDIVKATKMGVLSLVLESVHNPPALPARTEKVTLFPA
ncbi:MAG: protein FlhF [Deltaproteobacteria bacterium]|nr:protein FlhF [Deltaproteobacteria bacterium]